MHWSQTQHKKHLSTALWSVFSGWDSYCSCREALDSEEESDFGEIKEAFSAWIDLNQFNLTLYSAFKAISSYIN